MLRFMKGARGRSTFDVCYDKRCGRRGGGGGGVKNESNLCDIIYKRLLLNLIKIQKLWLTLTVTSIKKKNNNFCYKVFLIKLMKKNWS